MGFPYGARQSWRNQILTRSGDNWFQLNASDGAIGWLVRAWINPIAVSPLSSISTTTLTLGTAIPAALAVDGTVFVTAASGVTAGTRITALASGNGMTAGSTYTVSVSQNATTRTMWFAAASDTGKMVSFTVSPPVTAGNGANWESRVNATHTLSAAAVPYRGIVPGTVPDVYHIVALKWDTAATTGMLSPTCPFAQPWLSIKVDNTDTSYNLGSAAFDVWPIYGTSSAPPPSIPSTDFTTF